MMEEAPYSGELVDRLARAKRVAVLTGAGVSAESGIPTFRDIGGVWSKFKPEELANIDAFLGNPSLVQRWYQERRRIAQEALPNAGHEALVVLEGMFEAFSLITQNVDDLHGCAGSNQVIELHGNITRNYCIDCKQPMGEEHLLTQSADEPLACVHCGGLVRPDVVWFGEMLPAGAIEESFVLAKHADVFLSIGTSAVVYPAADIPLVARDHGAYVAEINIQASAIAPMLNETVLGPSGTVLPMLVEAVRTARASVKE